MSFAEVEAVLHAQLRCRSAKTSVEVIYSGLGLSRLQIREKFLECCRWREFTFSQKLDSIFLFLAKDSRCMKDVSHLHVLRARGGARGGSGKQNFPHFHNSERFAIGSRGVLGIGTMCKRPLMKLIVLLFYLSSD